MQFSLLLIGAPYSSQAPTTAYRFACAALQTGHSIYRVFFYHDAVYCGNRFNIIPSDQPDIAKQWTELAQTHNIDLVICSASAHKRGIIDQTEATRQQQLSSNLHQGFTLAGLGELIEAGVTSDRLITFGL